MCGPALGKDSDFDDTTPAGAPADFQRLRDEWPLADAAVADIRFDDTFVVKGTPIRCGWSTSILIAEYARHNGHADLLAREHRRDHRPVDRSRGPTTSRRAPASRCPNLTLDTAVERFYRLNQPNH